MGGIFTRDNAGGVARALVASLGTEYFLTNRLLGTFGSALAGDLANGAIGGLLGEIVGNFLYKGIGDWHPLQMIPGVLAMQYVSTMITSAIATWVAVYFFGGATGMPRFLMLFISNLLVDRILGAIGV